MDNEHLSLLTRAKFFQAYLEKSPDGSRGMDERSAKSLLEALRPITSVKVGKLPEDKVDYTFMFQSGRDPLVFTVHVCNDHLVYQERNYVYEGGDAESFTRVANEMLDPK